IAVPVEGPPPIALEPAVPPPAAAPSTTASGAGDAPAAGAPQVWVELHALARFHLPRAPAGEVTRLGQSVDAQVEIVAGDPDADRPAVARPAPRLLRVRLGGDVWHRQVIARDGVLHVELGADRELRGRVVDRFAGPVVGAAVFVGGAADASVTT